MPCAAAIQQQPPTGTPMRYYHDNAADANVITRHVSACLLVAVTSSNVIANCIRVASVRTLWDQL